MVLNLYNTLSRQKEEFNPIKKGEVGLYTCGPTVYNFAHLGNMRTYIFEDVLKRVLTYNNYHVKHVMNITDVGHLTGDRDLGEDKMEREAKKEGKTAWEIAEFYTEAFKEDLKNLNIIFPDIFCKATDNIKEQIEMIQKLEERGFTYKTSDGVYFDTSKVADYTKLSHQNIDDLREGARVEVNPEKKNATDFALWKFSPTTGEKRQMEWPSPWGVGFPGWHIECSAMSVKYLGEQFDIHCGGIDHIDVHHTNEIAQTESSTDRKPWVNFWLHGAFMNIVGGKKMAKSAGNFVTLQNSFIDKEQNPLAYRYACLSVHYRKPMEWSDEIAVAAQNGLYNLHNRIQSLGTDIGEVNADLRKQFLENINDDLNMPKALATMQEVLKAELSPADKFATILDFDKVLGLNLGEIKKEIVTVSPEVKKLLDEREEARKNKDWKKADELRDEILKLGFEVKDK
jgi:cysteinyl-tRNA synthetase